MNSARKYRHKQILIRVGRKNICPALERELMFEPSYKRLKAKTINNEEGD